MAALPLSQIFDRMPIASCVWDIQRNDEFSGTGTGDVWAAELAPPLWIGDVTLGNGTNNELKQAAALIRSLSGSQTAFLMCDPISQYPQADQTGLIFGASAVTLRTIGADRITARMQGFPRGYVLTIGDKLQIDYSASTAFVEVGDTLAADANGNLDVPIFPRLPSSVVAGLPVRVMRPACPVVIQPTSHNPGTATSLTTNGAAFKVIQKLRAN